MSELIIAAGGGHGTIYISKILIRNKFKVCMRPEASFGIAFDFNETPDISMIPEWRSRTKTDLDMNISIGENLLFFIHNNNFDLVLCGARFSANNKFITENKIKAVCLIRHPIHAYVSARITRHSNLNTKFGGSYTEAAIDDYANRWDSIARDFLSSGNDIIRYEIAKAELINTKRWNGIWTMISDNWEGDHRNSGIISKALEMRMFNIVKATYFKIYNQWKI